MNTLNDFFTNTEKWLEASGIEIPSGSNICDFGLSEIEEIRLAIEECDGSEDCLKADKTLAEIKDGIIDTIAILANLTFKYNIPLVDLLIKAETVAQSNWSKLCLNEEEAWKSVLAYSEGTHPDKMGKFIECKIVHKEGSKYWTVVRIEDGKLLKSINYKHPSYYESI
jgi:hypothetical protein